MEAVRFLKIRQCAQKRDNKKRGSHTKGKITSCGESYLKMSENSGNPRTAKDDTNKVRGVYRPN